MLVSLSQGESLGMVAGGDSSTSVNLPQPTVPAAYVIEEALAAARLSGLSAEIPHLSVCVGSALSRTAGFSISSVWIARCFRLKSSIDVGSSHRAVGFCPLGLQIVAVRPILDVLLPWFRFGTLSCPEFQARPSPDNPSYGGELPEEVSQIVCERERLQAHLVVPEFVARYVRASINTGINPDELDVFVRYSWGEKGHRLD